MFFNTNKTEKLTQILDFGTCITSLILAEGSVTDFTFRDFVLS